MQASTPSAVDDDAVDSTSSLTPNRLSHQADWQSLGRAVNDDDDDVERDEFRRKESICDESFIEMGY